MRSLRGRVLLLVVGFGLVMAALLAIVMHATVRQYYGDWMHQKNAGFAQRIVETHPELWADYLRDPAGFGATLSHYTLYSPDTGLYLLDLDGRVLAAAGWPPPHGRPWQVDVAPIARSQRDEPEAAILADDPESPGRQSPVAVQPVHHDGAQRGWLYVVARQADLATAMPALLRSYAVRAASAAGLMTIAIGALLTIAMISLLTRPLTALTRATERIRNSGFADDPGRDLFEDAGRDDEIGRLARTFREAFERLRQETERVRTIDAHRREMVASVSHDLRTPLTALVGQIETIRLKGDSLSPDAQAHLLGRALQNARHLERLTDALAELALIDSPEFRAQREPIALGELADDVVQRFAAAAQGAGIELSAEYPDGLPLTSADASLVERALANLLDNALRVTPAGGSVKVGVRRAGEAIRIEVADSGPGVAPEDQPRVFERFYQSSRHRALRGSSGLGLAIVKRVAELHGGSIGLRSEPGHGSVFFLDLPLAA